MWGKPTPQVLAVTPNPVSGDSGKTLTLGHVMSSSGIIPNITVADIMDIKGSCLCCGYVLADCVPYDQSTDKARQPK